MFPFVDDVNLWLARLSICTCKVNNIFYILTSSIEEGPIDIWTN